MGKQEDEAKVKKPLNPKKSRNERGSKRGPGKKKFENRKDKVLKNDNIQISGKLDDKHYKQNPNWYFKDAVQAEVMSRIQMNAFGGITQLVQSGNEELPTIRAFYMNPCPGVTPWDSTTTDPGTIYNGPSSAHAKGINRAAQKLWYILTAKSGRAAGYSKADCALLILAVGSMIETYEFIRRVFGIAYTYNQRNRALPNQLFEAMNVSMADYQANAATYLKKMNSLMAIMNELPIPGNVAWFAKCQDMFQNIYMDYPAEMAQLFIFCPSTAWVLEEDDGFLGGSYLRTVDMCLLHPEVGRNTSIASATIGRQTSGAEVSATSGYIILDRSIASTKTLQNYIDVFEEQINKLLFSSTFSTIYSDILRAFDSGTLSRWSFDYIDEKYNIYPIFDDNRLWMIHNATMFYSLFGPTRTTWQNRWTASSTYKDVFKYGTPLNDVYQWALPGSNSVPDIVVYNPSIATRNTRDTGTNRNTRLTVDDIVVDFPNDQPTVEQRIEYTRYISAPWLSYDKGVEYPPCDTANVAIPMYSINHDLPDHWIEHCEDFGPVGSDIRHFVYTTPGYLPANAASESTDGMAYTYNSFFMSSKYHHAPNAYSTTSADAVTGMSLTLLRSRDLMGELNAWTNIKLDWFHDINDMIYVDLFDIR